MAGGCHTENGVGHIQSKELALEHHLELMARGIVQLHVKGSEEAVKDGRGTTIASAAGTNG